MLHNNAVASVLRGQGLSAPITVTWEVTNRCNLRCAHCLSDSSPEADTRAELGLEEARRVVDQLAEARVFQIHFGGGEPFLFPGFMELLRHAQARGFCCLCISTNGAPLCMATANMLSSSRPADTSLMMSAPSASASPAISLERVSILIRT